VEEYRPANFGARRVINGDPRMPHSAVDIHLPGGTPVRAIADGRVAFAGEQFFGGRSVVIDHGGGVFSVYYHLKEISVAEGNEVSRGSGSVRSAPRGGRPGRTCISACGFQAAASIPRACWPFRAGER